jgi:hypothetical protein
MISSPCRDCDKLHMPKDRCMKDCEKIAVIQQSQNNMRVPPYARNDSFDTFDCLHDLPLVVAPSGVG